MILNLKYLVKLLALELWVIYQKLPDDSLKKFLKTAENFHNPIYAPDEDDWLSSQKEDGQTFNKFLSDRYNIMSINRNIIYINAL